MLFWYALSCVPPVPSGESPVIDSVPDSPPIDTDSDTPFLVVSSSPAQISASGGDLVVVSGSGFASGAQVSIGGTPAAVGALTADSIGVIAPPGAAGMADIVVTQDGESQTLPEAVEYMEDFAGAKVFSLLGWLRVDAASGEVDQYWFGYFDTPWEGGAWLDTTGTLARDTPFGKEDVDECVVEISTGQRSDFEVPYLDLGAVGRTGRIPRDRRMFIYTPDVEGDLARPGDAIYVSWPSGIVPAADGLQIGVFPTEAPTLTRPAEGKTYALGESILVEWEVQGGGPLELRISNGYYPNVICFMEDDGQFELPSDVALRLAEIAGSFGSGAFLLELGAVSFTEVQQDLSNAVLQTRLGVATTVNITVEAE